ncbi:hypothetical protein [Mycolicibacterium mageritense]|uniref:Uncharacterized protein n=1 Tax=Mycolicibacterium mageritense TaxID=53462 RepID=A0AAI8XQV1_MYCME|nr:hypothetical protein [Mycolicibacterium mageritense]BDY31392.1 hypothetical protein hbim_05344 [Mycolicibacterium mageritense]
MPRIRNIKPRFWDSPDTAKADLAPRLLFMALWNWADDSGRGTANLKELEAFAFPHDTVSELPRRSRRNSAGGGRNSAAAWPSFGHILAEVQECYGVVFYRVGSRNYFVIPSFKDHQSKHFKPDSALPAPEEGEIWDLTSEFADTDAADNTPPDEQAAEIRQLGAEVCRLAAAHRPLDGDKDGDRDGDVKDLSDPGGSNDPSPVDLDVTEADYPETFSSIYPSAFEEWWQHYPRKDSKKDALGAWRAACKRASKDDLINGAIRYANDPNRQPKYTKLPARWLRGDCWLSDQLPGDNNGRTVNWEAL